MTDQPWDLNKTWPVGRIDLQMLPHKKSRVVPKFGGKNHQIFDDLFRDFPTRHRISPERNVASTNQNASVDLQCVP